MSCFSRVELLKHGLRSIIKNKPDFPLEIVVVNDGLENDGTKEVCDIFGMVLNIKYVFTGQRHVFELIKKCPSIPNNVAIKQATGDIVILTCPEILHLNNAISLLIQPLLENKKILSIPEYMFFDDKGTYTKFLNKQHVVPTRFLNSHLEHVRMPFFMGVWKSEIEAIRGYDEDFTDGYASEDNDFVDRLVKNGCTYFRTSALVVHLFHGSHCSGHVQFDNPAWVRNKELYNARKEQIVRNVGKEWGVIPEQVSTEIPKIDIPIVPKEEPISSPEGIELQDDSLEIIFTDIYNSDKWGSKETPSGTGSELRATKNIRKEIPKLFKELEIKRVLDVGCGNVNWMRHLFSNFEFYLGIDVVEDLITRNRKEFGTKNIQFQQAIITERLFNPYEDLMPYEFDCVVLNDVLVHLSFSDIYIILEKLKKSKIKYILTTHFSACAKNEDISSGRWRPLNLNKFPFDFPSPLSTIDNTDEMTLNKTSSRKKQRGLSKSLSLWNLQELPVVNGIPKIVHLYWDKSPMAWLQTQTVVTFHKQNPDWQIKVHVPIQPYVVPNGKYVPDYTGKDYFHIVKSLPYVDIVEMDVVKYGIDPKLHNILQSDIFRYLMLYEVGGVWSDFDVLWIRPISNIYKVKTKGIIPTSEMGTFICKCEAKDNFHSIGVLMTKPGHPFYKTIIDKCFAIQEYYKDREKLHHQSFGTDIFDKLYPTFEYISKIFPDVVKMPYKTFYPYSIFNLELLYKEDRLDLIEDENVLCVHWFNGHRFSKNYINSETNINPQCTMSKIITLIEKGEL